MIKLWWRLVRFGFRLLYNEFAWTYDTVAWLVSGGEWRAWQRTAFEALNLATGSVILELAHGTGNLHIDLLSSGYKCVGIDRSRAMGRIAMRKIRRARFVPHLVNATAGAVPLATASVDGVVCTFPSEFLTLPATLSEVRRVLRPGARYAIVVHGVLLRGWWRPLLNVLFQATGQGGIQQDYVPTVETLNFRYERLVSAFTSAGLYCDVIPMLTPRGYAVVATGGSMPQ